jgi:hypothetical protein
MLSKSVGDNWINNTIQPVVLDGSL